MWGRVVCVTRGVLASHSSLFCPSCSFLIKVLLCFYLFFILEISKVFKGKNFGVDVPVEWKLAHSLREAQELS